jgi:hypothetical protein
MSVIANDLVLYERHTHDTRSNGVSIYLSNRHIPENIFRSHHSRYRRCHFSKDTAWDEMIALIRSLDATEQ